MYGRVKEYDEVNERGYIEGFDERIYFYHLKSIVKGNVIEVGEMVQFRYIMNSSPEELPVAINIFKVEDDEEVQFNNNQVNNE